METDLDLHTIRVVRAIADHGSISAAARALGFSQPAVSQHLRRVESRLGMPIVVRAGRSVRLTEPGQLIARHALAISAALDAANGDLAALSGFASGTVRVAAFPSASSTLIPRLLHDLRSRHPGIAVNYVECEPPEATALLRDGAVDLAVTFSYPGDRAENHRATQSQLESVPLFTEQVMIVLPADHPQATQRVLQLETLRTERWIAGCPLCRGHLLAACAAVGMTPVIDLETDNAVAVLNLVAAGLGVALLPRLALATSPVPAGAVVREFRPSSDRAIELVVQSGARRVPSIAAAVEAITTLDVGDWARQR